MVRDHVLPAEDEEDLDIASLAWGVDDRCMDGFDPSDPYKNIDPEVLARIDGELKERGFPGA